MDLSYNNILALFADDKLSFMVRSLFEGSKPTVIVASSPHATLVLVHLRRAFYGSIISAWSRKTSEVIDLLLLTRVQKFHFSHIPRLPKATLPCSINDQVPCPDPLSDIRQSQRVLWESLRHLRVRNIASRTQRWVQLYKHWHMAYHTVGDE
jgi:hypothetical protein